jgi:ubiquinone/menaquinone biosynthesis C-methylase UbiE
MRVLNVGCGTGRLLSLAARRTGSTGVVIGLDAAVEALDIARRRTALDRHVAVEWADVTRGIPMEAGSLDAVLIHRVLEAASDLAPVLRDAGRVLRKSGALAVVASWQGDGQALARDVVAGAERAGFRVQSVRVGGAGQPTGPGTLFLQGIKGKKGP